MTAIMADDPQALGDARAIIHRAMYEMHHAIIDPAVEESTATLHAQIADNSIAQTYPVLLNRATEARVEYLTVLLNEHSTDEAVHNEALHHAMATTVVANDFRNTFLETLSHLSIRGTEHPHLFQQEHPFHQHLTARLAEG